MKTATMSQSRLAELLDRFPACRIAVVGDFFLDKYLEIEPAWEEISRETGKPAHQVSAVRVSPGAAGTVVANLQALGAGDIHAVGFTGPDGEGFELRAALEKLNCRIQHLQIAPRFTPTYLKPRNVNPPGLEGEHSRYDTQNRQPTPRAVENRVIQSLKQLLNSVDAVVVLDQVEEENCGVVTETVREAIGTLARQSPDVRFWADSRRNIRQFRNVLIKPNQFEAWGTESSNSGTPLAFDPLLKQVRTLSQTNQAPVFLTRGQEGLVVVDDAGDTWIPGVHLEGPTDPTGAGDSLTAGCVLALCAGASWGEAAIVGNLVASLTVQQLATTGTAQPHQLADRLELWLSQRTHDA